MARSWDDIQPALLGSQAESAIDEIVVISKQAYHLQRFRGLRPVNSVHFVDDEDLLRKLSLTNSALAAPLSPLAATFVPQTTYVPRSVTEQRSSNPRQSIPTATPIEEQSEGLQHVSYTGPQERAVCKIQRAFRRSQLRKGGASGGPLFLAFNETVQRLQQVSLVEKRTYCIYLRGPMPHVLSFLEKFLDHAKSAKKEVNRKLKEGEHQTLERLQRKSKKIR